MVRRKKKTTKKQKPSDPFSKLTWEDIEEWAGAVIVGRGRPYQRNGAVENLGRTAGGTLAAWVRGTRRYATRVRLTERNGLESACTCPYWDTCKHAVAVVLEYLERLKTDSAIGEIDEDDPRLLKLEAIGDEDDEYEEFAEEEEEENVKARSGRSKSKTASLRPYLQEQTKAELVALVIELADAHDAVCQLIADRRDLTSGQTDKILQTIRREISALEEPVWDEYDNFPALNTDRLKAALKGLAQAGQADAAMRLGPELLATAHQALQYDSEGEFEAAFSDCLDVLFQVSEKSSLSPADQVEWALDMALADEYGLCDAGLDQLWKRRYAKSDWSAVSDRLAQRIEASKDTKEELHYERDRLTDWLIRVLEKAGRQDEIIPLCEREAPITFSYERLVDRLMAKRRWEEARRWCHQGIEAVASIYPGIETAMHKQLQTINWRSGNPLAGLAIQAEEFFATPGLFGFQELCKAARKARAGKGVEAWARHYLETGRRPGVGRKRKSDPKVAWPLPRPEVEVPNIETTEAPMSGILTQLAIAEKKPDEVLKWYDYAGRKKGGSRLSDFLVDATEVAEAVKSAYPERAIAIWQETAEEHIARVSTNGYEASVPYLRKMKNALTRAGRKQEWDEYLASLREENKRRPRCLEVLGRLEGGRRRIIDP
ncbi:MAG: SWIM zinc finger family protein [Gemmatimonadetes bacterium]|nr:SWIM zinc finger family protein [Gemmatimonadota bacterium]